MPIRIDGLEGNSVDASDDFLLHQNGVIRFTGKGGVFRVQRLTRSADINITVGDRCAVEIGEDCHLSILTVYTERDSSVIIGNGVAFTWDCQISCHESYNVDIGDGCLVAPKTFLSVSDMHTIYETNTRKRINHGGDIRLGDNVWVGAGSSVMKGVEVGRGSIIGLGSIVTRSVPEYSAVAGIPARVVKKNVSWHHSLHWIDPAPEPQISARRLSWPDLLRAFFRRYLPLRSL